jgi:thiamine biosynthesis lipoprotein
MRHQVVEFTAMGCPCSVEAFAKSEAQLHECLALARAEIERIEAKYSRYRHGSWLSELNRSAGLSDSIELDQESRGLFDFADQLYIISKHRFDITSGVLGTLWRFAAQDDPMTAPPSQKAIDEILPLVNQRLIERGPDAIRLPLVGMSVDFGGIAKEYACDRVAQLLRLNGIDGGCVCLGGDITVFGKRDDERPWLIGIERPQQPTLIEHAVSLSNASLATSGDYARCFDFEGKRYGHLLDATTGWPVHDLRSVSVIAPLCTAAGAVARLAMLQGATWQRFLLEQGLAWRVVDANDHIHAGGDFDKAQVSQAMIRG